MLRTTRGMPAEATILQKSLGRASLSRRPRPLVVRKNRARGMPKRLPTETPRLFHASLSLMGKIRMEYRPIRAAAMSSQSTESSCSSKSKIMSSSEQALLLQLFLGKLLMLLLQEAVDVAMRCAIEEHLNGRPGDADLLRIAQDGHSLAVH